MGWPILTLGADNGDFGGSSLRIAIEIFLKTQMFIIRNIKEISYSVHWWLVGCWTCLLGFTVF